MESWLERDEAMALDSDATVTSFAPQPFWPFWPAGTGRVRSHTPEKRPARFRSYQARRSESRMEDPIHLVTPVRPRFAGGPDTKYGCCATNTELRCSDAGI
ncbi:hypothetical protein GCM10009779_10970 [Polymorphospora rubra]|uniref:Uncharacterized protein n=1 Tax=Polymorphospora rubra TaxID=338584 RepID=A0A810NBA6_9ACTN|nr:hypothetical protein Prubr_61390 [Polymorphospora rubra]